MKILIYTSFLFSFFVTWPNQIASQANDCELYEKADARLNMLYNQILNEYVDDHTFISKFKSAQRAWLRYRDAHLNSIFPEESPGYYGSVKQVCDCIHLAEITDQRNEQLKVWIDGVEEGEVCAGSIKRI